MDRSLDEIIGEDTRNQNRPSGGGRRNQGPGRRRGDRDGVRKPYSQDRVNLDLDWVHDKYDDDRDTRPSRGGRRSRRSTSPERGGPMLTKVRVENLHYDINESDLEDLFGKIGPVTDLTLVYDRAGRSEGVAYVTYKHLKDAHESVKEFDGANAKGHPIRLTLVPGRREQHKSLFDRVERPGRDARSLSPGGARGEQSDGRRRGGRARRSDVSKPAPENIDRYIPGERGDRSPRRNGGRRGGRDSRRNEPRNENGGRRAANGRPRKTQEELDQEMEDYWGGNAGTDNADKPAEQEQQTAAPAAAAATTAPAAPAAPVNDDDIDMIE
ncbi:RNA binding protein [Penicillium sp. IBT 35674x]|nr:RNA binding protein [Penicillium sp. IBT 35674x]